MAVLLEKGANVNAATSVCVCVSLCVVCVCACAEMGADAQSGAGALVRIFTVTALFAALRSPIPCTESSPACSAVPSTRIGTGP